MNSWLVRSLSHSTDGTSNLVCFDQITHRTYYYIGQKQHSKTYLNHVQISFKSFKRIRIAEGRKQCNVPSKHDSFSAARSCHLVSNSGQNAVCLPPSLWPHAASARSLTEQTAFASITHGIRHGRGRARACTHTRVTPHFIPLDRTQSWRGNRLSHV